MSSVFKVLQDARCDTQVRSVCAPLCSLGLRGPKGLDPLTKHKLRREDLDPSSRVEKGYLVCEGGNDQGKKETSFQSDFLERKIGFGYWKFAIVRSTCTSSKRIRKTGILRVAQIVENRKWVFGHATPIQSSLGAFRGQRGRFLMEGRSICTPALRRRCMIPFTSFRNPVS